ncbi:MAG: hypothetical protein AB7G17_03350 [Phycisphaerales bacterium]
MTATLNAKAFDSLIKTASNKYGPIELAPAPLLDQFVWSYLLWEATLADAERAFKKVTAAVVDFNELRVCLPDEIVAIIGPRYPRASERAAILKKGLHSVFLREHAVSLEHLKDANKRAARQYLESLEGVPPFVSGRVLVLGLGAHAAPLDERLMGCLADEDVFEGDEIDLARASSLLERHIKAEDGLATHLTLLRWAEDAAGKPRRGAKRPKARKA